MAHYYVCPNCGSDNIKVTASIGIIPTDNGYEVSPWSGAMWNDVSDARCYECSWEGTFANLETRKDPEGEWVPEPWEAL